ncbi:DegT/DnrJ/EryC1/StrS family aminotransferase [Frankia sp. CN6]|uniref:DegT/DnrJ/EryC1/StrS family aminotransferase n=2 Tax=Frankia nepalensis TaxID=1836974 RepID=A0A937R5P7_9ACTN|nr:DegT/DnrJ/EryC1/StrS family aminotransferase [Frankia nepalensis]MBL7625716.1 DegT/DnrJ/EryC1/StrS family aminotransferase [Frankia nepalensis]
MTTIPVMKPWLGEEEAAAAAEAVRSGWVAQGPRVARFEQAFAAHAGTGHGVATSSCTTALQLGLLLLGIGPGDDVVVPSLSFIATANVVRHVGATPVFADVDPQTANLTAKTVEAVVTPATRAVIAVHQAGMPADTDELRTLCTGRGLAVLEDAACAAGSTYRDAPVGAAAELAAWSFHPRKLLTTGEGGMLTLTDPDLADRARRLREHGMNISAATRHTTRQPVLESYLETGWNMRMTDIQAAIGLIQLAKLDTMVTRRRELAAGYRQRLADLPGLYAVTDPPHGQTNYQSFWIRLPDDFPMSRNELLAFLAERGISARRGIMATHLEPAYRGHPHGDLTVTEALTAQTLILPLFHTMTEAEQDHVAAALREAAQGGATR